jgi:deoxyribose-phosphate aldolase
MKPNELAPYLDLANHHANATHADIETICTAVATNGFNAAFLNPFFVPFAKKMLNAHGKVGTVVSFPLGQDMLSIKIASAKAAAMAGADELDVMLNVACIKEAKWHDLLFAMTEIISTARTINSNIIVKFIPETGYLTSQEIKKMAELMVQAGADFFKTCSGMGPRGATLEDVRLIRAAVGSDIRIKVAGDITTYAQAISFIEAGADRIGTSKAVEICAEQP